ncbi:RNA polymerase subunit sigma-70 [Actinomadura rudentiformis]|uniref:RNA polymerase sigma factor n=1 Tax=Actinomadura rudentiformis TaxID=359158 RepID=A0A6H9YA54_9ACTN|nr:RNA polymerase subunit sigma-70 [Actinomadura rudentiformis]KAB2339687.1 sigma-70 family RNA polymerase sigma factor [Actinomadura rudentiformis]
MNRREDAAVDDEAVFTELVEDHRRELQVHCYRMVGSFDEAQDLVQETFLRAWRGRHGFQGASTFRAWLYRIATNACLDFLARHPRPALPSRPPQTEDPGTDFPSPVAVPWLQPYPDRLLEGIAPRDAEPDAAVVAKETIELAFLAAIQYLTPRQRAVLILRDILAWPAGETAALLQTSVASVNSGLQRARLTMRIRLPERRLEWAASSTTAERAVLKRYMDALERADDEAVAGVLREDARAGHQGGAGGHGGTDPVWYRGRETIVKAWAPILHGADAPALRLVPTRANRQPAVATYICAPGASAYSAFALSVLRIEGGAVAEVATFGTRLFPAFDLPATL